VLILPRNFFKPDLGIDGIRKKRAGAHSRTQLCLTPWVLRDFSHHQKKPAMAKAIAGFFGSIERRTAAINLTPA